MALPLINYYGIAATHVGKKFNVCVLEKQGDAPIKKSQELSWFNDNPNEARESLHRFIKTVIEVAKLQIESQKEADLKYSLPYLISLHDFPEDILDEELAKTKPYQGEEEEFGEISKLSKEKKGVLLVNRKLLEAIESGKLNDLFFSCAEGQYSGYKKNAPISKELLEQEETLSRLNQEAKEGQEIALNFFKIFARKRIAAIVTAHKEANPNGKLSFIGFAHPMTEKLNLPPIIEFMKEELRRYGINPESVDIKFPSDEGDDYYYNVLRPEMDRRIQEHKAQLTAENHPINLLDLLLALRTLKAINQED